MNKLAQDLLTSWIDNGVFASHYIQPEQIGPDDKYIRLLTEALHPIAQGMRELVLADVDLTYIRANNTRSPLTTHQRIVRSTGVVAATKLYEFARPGSVFNAGAGLPFRAIVLEVGYDRDGAQIALLSLLLPRRTYNMQDTINTRTRAVITLDPFGRVTVGYEAPIFKNDAFDQYLVGAAGKEELFDLRGGTSSGPDDAIDLAVGHMSSLRLLGEHVPRLSHHCRTIAQALRNGEPQSTIPRGGG